MWHSSGTDGAKFGAQPGGPRFTQNSGGTLEMARMQNLKPLPEGVSGICAGRLKKELLTDELKRL